MTPKEPKNPKIGIAISGGAIRGISALGIIQSLLDQGIQFSAVSGTSVGSVIGAYLACYQEISTLTNKFMQMTPKDWLKLLDFSIRHKQSLLKGKRYHAFINTLFADKTFSQLKTKLFITGTNINTGQVKYFTSGKITDAIIASSAYPGILPPYKVHNNLYIDGGISDYLPYGILLKSGIQKVICINLSTISKDNQHQLKSTAAVIMRSVDLMMTRSLKLPQSKDKRLFIFAPQFGTRIRSSWDISNLHENFATGQREFHTKQDEFNKWLHQ